MLHHFCNNFMCFNILLFLFSLGCSFFFFSLKFLLLFLGFDFHYKYFVFIQNHHRNLFRVNIFSSLPHLYIQWTLLLFLFALISFSFTLSLTPNSFSLKLRCVLLSFGFFDLSEFKLFGEKNCSNT